MPSTLYNYTDHNLLDKGEYYMFSRYQGVALLDDFISQRTRFLEKYTFVEQRDWMAFSVPDISDIDNLSLIKTRYVLQALLSTISTDYKLRHETIYRWLSRFLRCFEVTKKLYTCYTSDMKPFCQDFHLLVNYGLLSLCLSLYYGKTGNLKMLNGTLKLNDVLCSIPVDSSQPDALMITVLAIRSELKMVKLLASSKGVKL